MTGPKLNDNVLVLDAMGLGGAQGSRQPSTRAVARYVRGSASKAREVLDLIRGLDVRRADEVLQFTARGAAPEVRKVLASAVANAIHNDAQDPEELFVLACYADEGPTLKRFKPRARGRASRIRKRTCHITVIVARMSDDRLEIVQARQAAGPGARRPGTSAVARRERVARSRARADALRSGATPEEAKAAEDAAAADATDNAEDTVVEEALEEDADELVDDSEGAADVEAVADEDLASVSPQTPSDGVVRDREVEEAPSLPAGAVEAPEDGSVPDGYPIKGNTNSMKYHEPGGRYYDVTIAELFFDTVESAEAAGYEAPGGGAAKKTESESE